MPKGEFEVNILSSARKEARNIDKSQLCRIIEALKGLAANPYPRGCRKLIGFSNSYRLRVGHYRILYEVDGESMCVTVFAISHRKDAYRK
ncbi:MAG: type II toxin-antitoxin system RelE/ParE family toxin [Candidatus Marinimicrobia bacterium]|nr:type II toxin-antitoxin system RelE/ParE family toxin [Candidatus Neomarinimicrobiota bacterium]MCK9559060.1 type II toxin-antitoxin system RelE/ParE family toxin [Candidatus Neomarinimicrobiota bacterium]MDD5060702.1 type II toxin-antitoxin system RelE/ParE family toxin [Candidatus Neomarinimicrobiota bacterium]MDD5539165.1 type II toxin-antitoxin system RelE/ParE family toxin [Candidatus Neomarinimicrobiota bacterium]